MLFAVLLFVLPDHARGTVSLGETEEEFGQRRLAASVVAVHNCATTQRKIGSSLDRPARSLGRESARSPSRQADAAYSHCFDSHEHSVADRLPPIEVAKLVHECSNDRLTEFKRDGVAELALDVGAGAVDLEVIGKGHEPQHLVHAETSCAFFARGSEDVLPVERADPRPGLSLEQLLEHAPGVATVERLDVDAMHDSNVTMTDGRHLRVECKNASPRISASGAFKVEVQKTRASKGDPASRFYPTDGFDVVAACLFSPTGHWEFRYGRTSRMARHKDFPDRLAPIQTISDDWTSALADLSQ